jgi:hypothetical protein
MRTELEEIQRGCNNDLYYFLYSSFWSITEESNALLDLCLGIPPCAMQILAVLKTIISVQYVRQAR